MKSCSIYAVYVNNMPDKEPKAHTNMKIISRFFETIPNTQLLFLFVWTMRHYRHHKTFYNEHTLSSMEMQKVPFFTSKSACGTSSFSSSSMI